MGRRWVWFGAASVVAIGALLLAGTVVDTHQRAAADRLAAVPGMVRRLPDVPRELWRAPAAEGLGMVAQSSGALVLVSLRAPLWWVTAYDAASGAQRWSVPLSPTSIGGTAVVAQCPSDPTVDDGVVLCVARGPRREAAPTHVLALDVASGRRVGGWSVDYPVIGLARIGSDLVVGALRPDGRVRVQRADGVTGAVRWSYLTADIVENATTGRAAEVAVGARRTVVRGVSSDVLDNTSGAVLVTAPVGVHLDVVDIPTGFATFDTVQGGRLYREGSERWVGLRGLPARLDADDGSGRGLLVVDTGAQLRGVDPASGTVRWQLPSGLDPVAVASGVLVTAADGSYGAVDVRTGAPLWQVRVGLDSDAQSWVPRTDGAHVIGLEVGAGGELLIVARGLRDGIRTWSTPLPTGTDRLDTVGGRLLARGPADVVVLG